MQQLTVLGSTGSIGVSTLDVVSQHPDKYSIFALSCHRKTEVLAKQCIRFKPKFAVVSDPGAAADLIDRLKRFACETRVLAGIESLALIANHAEVDTVMAAIVGAAGLEPTLAAAIAGKRVLLANKEALVMAGPLFMQAVEKHSATLLPIDSEHNAIFQCLPPEFSGRGTAGVSKVLLSASGGPFLNFALGDLSSVTPEQACSHPNWSMGRKISVDSATMMNKGLELIEACYLFNLTPADIDIVIHPQSVVHSLVAYADGSVLAQMGNPDMRTPIAHALAWPDRIDSGVVPLDLPAIARLDFSTPDLKQFPCLALAIESARQGGSAPTILNAANEVAVEAFLGGEISFTQIHQVVERVLHGLVLPEPVTLEQVKIYDAEARILAQAVISQLSVGV